MCVAKSNKATFLNRRFWACTRMSYCLVIAKKKNLRKMLQAVVCDYQTKRLNFKFISFQHRAIVFFEMFYVWMVSLEEENQKESSFERQSFHEFLIFLRKSFSQHFFLFRNFNCQKIFFTKFFRFQLFNFCRNNWVNLKPTMNFLRPN